MDDRGKPEARRGRRVTRRGALGAAAAAALGAAVAAEAQGTQEPVSAADVTGAADLAGRTFTDAQKAAMSQRLNRTRTGLQALRAVETGPLDAPAFHFDPRVPGVDYPTRTGRFRISEAPVPDWDGAIESVAFHSVTDLSRMIKSRVITSSALTRMYFERLKKFGPPLNCVVTMMEEHALAQAQRADAEIAAGRYRGPLHGIPWGAKDLLATKSVRTTWGAKPFESQIFDYDATVVRKLDAAGAVLMCKLTTGELALGDLWFGGRTRNPWDPRQGSSGSSAGPGSATAAGLLAFAIGSETLGSIVSPSVVNGVTGLRPTFGRVSRHGAMPLSWTMDKLGPMCRGVEDCAVILRAIMGPDGHDPTVTEQTFEWDPDKGLADLRVGYDPAAFEGGGRTPSRKPVYDEVLKVLRDKLGLKLIPVKLPDRSAAYEALAGLTIDVESAAAFSRLVEDGRLDTLAGPTWPLTFRSGSLIPAADYIQAMRVRAQLQRAMHVALKDVDLYVTVPFAGPTIFYTNLTGHPTLITRCGMQDDQPVSIEITGNLYREDAILRLGRAFEQATEWHRKWPDPERTIKKLQAPA